MSNFRSKAFNPASKRVEDAEYCDDYYGRHRYGIRFDDGCVHPEAQCGIVAAATQLDALLKERDALQAERDELRMQFDYAMQEFQIRNDELKAAESRALRAEQELNTELCIGSHTEAVVLVVDLRRQLALAQQERDELQQVFDSRWEADQRAIKAWQAAHPNRPNIWPDHADMVVWLLQERDEAVTFIREAAKDSYLDDHDNEFRPTLLAQKAGDIVRRLAGPEKEGK